MHFRRTLTQLTTSSCLLLMLIAGHKISWFQAREETQASDQWMQPSLADLPSTNAADRIFHPPNSSDAAGHHEIAVQDRTSLSSIVEPDHFPSAGSRPLDSWNHAMETDVLNGLPNPRRSSSQVALLESEQTADASNSSRAKRQRRPQTRRDESIPDEIIKPSDAVPLVPDPDQASEFDRLFEEEWPNATPEEREIWGKQLEGLPPEFARELLRLRESNSIVPSLPSLPGSRSAPPRKSSVDREDSPFDMPTDEAGDASRIPDHVRAAIDILRQAQGMVLQNLLHTGTTGYKRVIPRWGESIPEQLNNHKNGVTEFHHKNDTHLSSSLDVSGGPFVQTGRELDTAINGTGWFCMMYDEKAYFTRNGNWHLTKERTLSIVAGGRRYLMTPTITVPENATRIVIDSNGTVSAIIEDVDTDKDPSESVSLGIIPLATFFDESSLEHVGNAIYAATVVSGKPRTGQPGTGRRGKIVQLHLEQSNVDGDRELKVWEELKRDQQMLLELALP